MISLKHLLARAPLEASAPCRVDSGGTMDIKALALPQEKAGPVTVNFALNLRTSVTLRPYENGAVRIVSEGFAQGEVRPAGELPFSSAFGTLFAAAAYFQVHGLEIRVSSASPVQSALGGSSTALVALILALAKTSVALGGRGLSKREILHLAYHLEDGVSGGHCGLQDQAAAVYGGAHRWEWRYGNPRSVVKRVRLLDRRGERELSRRLLVAYSGQGHNSHPINRRWIRDFLSGATRAGWMEVNTVVRDFSRALAARDWSAAAGLLRQEMTLRRAVTPEALTPVTAALIDHAEQAGCGARFAGAGGGGSLWALGRLGAVEALRASWAEALRSFPNARMLDCEIDHRGVE